MEYKDWEVIGSIGDRLLSFWLTDAVSAEINEVYYKNRIKMERKRVKSMLSAQKVRMLRGGGMTTEAIFRETRAQGEMNVEAIRHERTVAKVKARGIRGASQIKRLSLLKGGGKTITLSRGSL